MVNIRKETALLIQENVNLSLDDALILFEIGLLQDHICKRILIRYEYFKKCSNGCKTQLKIKLADKYCVSMSTVEKYIVI
jgi:hypothetical protein